MQGIFPADFCLSLYIDDGIKCDCMARIWSNCNDMFVYKPLKSEYSFDLRRGIMNLKTFVIHAMLLSDQGDMLVYVVKCLFFWMWGEGVNNLGVAR